MSSLSSGRNAIFNHRLKSGLVAAAALALLSACVSVNLGPKDADKSDDVSFEPPGGSFKSLSDTHADRAWLNSANGNSISFLSSCNDPADPSLDSAARELFADLTDANTIESNTVSFNGRDALANEVEGKVDGVATRIRAILFKKNNCLYTLSYIGVVRAFEQDRRHFENFLKDFKAP